MNPTRWQQLLFNLRTRSPLRSRLRKLWYRLCGMQIGPNTSIAPISVTWPHLLRLWDCRIEPGVIFHITADSALSPVDNDHLIQPVGIPIFEKGLEGEIVIGENVWLGSNVIVLKGITIGAGAIVGAGAVVTKSIPPDEIWAGVPAKKISQRPPAGH
jgi:acetyltransferase-like isoleucine patch superfamily enzyme